MQAFAKNIYRLIRDEHGVTAIEYGLIAAGIALSLISTLPSISAGLTSVFGLVPGWFALV